MNLTQAMMLKKQDGILQRMLDDCVTDFWDKWYKNVFDVRTADEFGLYVWSLIVGDPRPYYNNDTVSLEVWRKYIISRIFQRTHICTLPNINKWMKLIFPENYKQYVYENRVDSGGNPRTMTLTYEFKWDYKEDPSYSILIDHVDDFLPHPAGVFVEILRNINVTFFGMNDTNNATAGQYLDSHGQRSGILASSQVEGTNGDAGILAGSYGTSPIAAMDGEHYGTVLKITLPSGTLSENLSFKMYVTPRTGEEVTVQWGDNKGELVASAKYVTHTYAASGTYTVVLSNECSSFKVGEHDETVDDYKAALKEIVALSNFLESMDYTFAYCRNITKFPASWPTYCTSATGAYLGCVSLTDISAFELPDVTTDNPYDRYLMPERITSHANCVSGTTGDVLAAFTSDWGGTKAS